MSTYELMIAARAMVYAAVAMSPTLAAMVANDSSAPRARPPSVGATGPSNWRLSTVWSARSAIC
jgi:hypothetical protein